MKQTRPGRARSPVRKRPGDAVGFLQAWEDQVGSWTPVLQRRGRKPRVPLGDVLSALTFHQLPSSGTLSQHFQLLFGRPFSDSAWSDRRQRLPWVVFTDLLQRVLRPRARPRAHPSAFWRGFRLLAVDGTQFSLVNTPQILATTVKARTRRARAAFAKLTTAVLLEVGAHNPIAAAIGRDRESEWALGLRVVQDLPARVLLLADRLYGVPAFLAEILPQCQARGSHLLVRVRRDLTSRVVRRLPDGSCLVRVPLRARASSRVLRHLEIREIRVTVARPGHRSHRLRLWTTLHAVHQAPALELAQLYTQRWEHELYFREVKRHLRRSALLHSHTVETAAQEVAALILASALVAAERLRLTAGQAPVLCVSFSAVLEITRAMWFTLSVVGDVLAPDQVATMIKRAYALAARCVVRKRPGRQCPRALRQPVKPWPRLIDARSTTAPVTLAVVRS